MPIKTITVYSKESELSVYGVDINKTVLYNTDMSESVIKTGERFRKIPGYIFWGGFIIGALLFLLIYGPGVLNFTYDGWIFKVQDPDIHQHYLGWCHFRRSPWFFPPGLMDSLSYPHRMSILWTDSIPLLAIIFKCFSAVLPGTFQYFGMYGLLSFCLTGGCTAVITKKLTGNDMITLLAVPFVTVSFPMLQRMFYHTSLTAHYLILIPFIIWLYDGYRWSLKKKCLVWGGYFFITVMLHPYLWLMGAVTAVAVFIDEIILTKDIKPAFITGAAAGLLTYIALFITGALYGNVKVSYALGGFGSNLNTFINSLGMSLILPALPLQSSNQYEGFGYLGIGGLILVFIAVILFFADIKKRKDRLPVSRREVIALILMAVFFLMAVFPDITINTKLILGIKVSPGLEAVLGIFRSTGRFIWPVVILLYLGAVREIAGFGESRGKRALPVIIICVCLVLQLIDMSGTLYYKNRKFTRHSKPLHSDLENEALADRMGQYEHIVFVTDDHFSMERSAYFAVKNGLTVNKYYFARNIDEQVEETLRQYHDECASGKAPENIIFVFDEETMKEWKKDTDLHFYDLTGTIVGLADEIDWPEIQ